MTPPEPTAPGAAERGTEAWREAERLQRWAVGDHGDFYELASEIDQTLYALHGLAITLRSQVTQYGNGRVLYDDTRSVDPAERLAMAAEALGTLARALTHAHRFAGEFHSAISHIGVET